MNHDDESLNELDADYERFERQAAMAAARFEARPEHERKAALTKLHRIVTDAMGQRPFDVIDGDKD